MPGAVSVGQFQEAIISFMKKSDLYDDKIVQEVPKSWEKYGDFILFQNNCFISSHWLAAGETLWELICSLLKCRRIGLKGKIINDSFRSPKIILLFGEAGEVHFTDNGIIYTWDIERSMFCRGNVSERHRIANLDCRNEIIVDLFAGIGYFTLPYLVKANALLVHACEWNPHAVKALRKNLELNNVSKRCKIHEGDNRKFAPKNVGHRINVGLIPDSQEFWKCACEALLSSGGTIYIHQNITSKITSTDEKQCPTCISSLKESQVDPNYCVEVNRSFIRNIKELPIEWKKPEWFKFSIHISHVLLDYLEHMHNNNWKIIVEEYFKVKSYAPHINHIVYSVHCSPL